VVLGSGLLETKKKIIKKAVGHKNPWILFEY